MAAFSPFKMSKVTAPQTSPEQKYPSKSKKHHSHKVFESYGLIAFRRGAEHKDRPTDLKTLYYRLVQRRDTSAYITFLQGKVPVEKYPRYFSAMTPEEHHRLSSFSYSILWEDLFFKRDYNKDFAGIFEKLDVNKLIRENPAKGTLKWEFPKGKKITRSENHFVCALREYREETLDQAGIKVVDSLPYQISVQEGEYTKVTTFFIAKPSSPINIQQRMISCLHRESRTVEVSAMKWAKLDECLQLLSEDLCAAIKQIDELLKKPFTLIDVSTYIEKYVFIRNNINQIRFVQNSSSEPGKRSEMASSLPQDHNRDDGT